MWSTPCRWQRKRPGKTPGKRGRENYTECDRATACPRLFQGRVQSVHNQTSMRRTALDTHLSCAAWSLLVLLLFNEYGDLTTCENDMFFCVFEISGIEAVKINEDDTIPGWAWKKPVYENQFWRCTLSIHCFSNTLVRTTVRLWKQQKRKVSIAEFERK